jgi:PAS domain S-box-containing protein
LDPYRVLFETANAIVACFDAQRRVTDWNREAERVFGCLRREVLGQTCDELFGNERTPHELTRLVAQVLSGIPIQPYETRRRARDGSARTLLCSVSRFGSGAAPPQIVVIAQDITDRARLEAAHRTNEDALNQAQALAQVGSWAWSLDDDVVTWSRELFRIAGRDPRLGAPPFTQQEPLYSKASWPRLREEAARMVATGEPYQLEVEMVRPDGQNRWVILRGVGVRDASGRIAALHGTAQDVTERRHDQEALQAAHERLEQSERRYRQLVEKLNDVVFSLDLEGVIQYVSPAVEKYGYTPSELVGTNFNWLVHPDDLTVLRDAVERADARALESWEFTTFDKQGSARRVRVSAAPLVEDGRRVGTTGILIDVTQQRKTEEQLRVAQRLEAVGRLAGGVAHDFNNLLVAINGYAEFALDRVPEGHPIRPDLEEILKAGHRAAALTRQLLAFSRRQVLKPQVIGLNDVLRGMEPLLRRLISEDIELRTRLTADLGSVLADRSQVEQVVMNLVVNARDAMPKGGVLTLETANGELAHNGRTPVEAVLLKVTDTGSGMDEATKAKIFEPFFSTKPQGEGTGLGLPMVYGIVQQSGGAIAVDTAPRAGTCFTISFPRDRAEAVTPQPAPAARPQRGTETILVVETKMPSAHWRSDF